ncbi:hypothetical protein SLEP1_g14810 [Rubroshorea leprosula]|uniref:Reverse transcriptase domain-containing protein n=1 Tax=Rubroshorea leprosula TaxID=152421 RepID=A0AAV5IX01_9ROSI|nr:hypothetical protein SLEP1_g14810 [Rubroshorea leprosula]
MGTYSGCSTAFNFSDESDELDEDNLNSLEEEEIQTPFKGVKGIHYSDKLCILKTLVEVGKVNNKTLSNQESGKQREEWESEQANGKHTSFSTALASEVQVVQETAQSRSLNDNKNEAHSVKDKTEMDLQENSGLQGTKKPNKSPSLPAEVRIDLTKLVTSTKRGRRRKATIQPVNFGGQLPVGFLSNSDIIYNNKRIKEGMIAEEVKVELQKMIKEEEGFWCIVGDFNSVRSEEARGGRYEHSHYREDLNDFIASATLNDLPLTRRKFTWTRKLIRDIYKNGSWMEEPNEVKQEVREYFKNIFQEEKWDRPKLDGLQFKQLDNEDKIWLKRDISTEEVLANRIKKVLSKVISGTQFAFLGGRQITDGILILNEVVEEIKKKKVNSFIFKADFEKAYDCVNWNFLDEMMWRLGFGEKWRTWIKECLQTTSVSVLVNGSPTNEFKMEKGIRQGDPIAPFLFLIIAKSLNVLIESAISKELFQGVDIGLFGPNISHLQFADGTVIMGKANPGNIKAVKGILRWFKLVLGLKINFNKSVLYSFNVFDGWGRMATASLNCKSGSIPFTYLGMPVRDAMGRRKAWIPIIENFNKKLAVWKAKCLSIGGRVTLLSSVLSTLPIYFMFIFKIPKIVLHELVCLQRKFLWGYTEEKSRTTNVMDVGHFSNGFWTWRNAWRRKPFGKERNEEQMLKESLMGGLVFSAQLDQRSWNFDATNGYNVSKAYSMLARWDLEDENHLFVQCPKIQSQWMRCYNWWGISLPFPNSTSLLCKAHSVGIKKVVKPDVWFLIFLVVTCAIWYMRNSIIHKAQQWDESRTFDLIQRMTFVWIRGKSTNTMFPFFYWCNSPSSCDQETTRS